MADELLAHSSFDEALCDFGRGSRHRMWADLAERYPAIVCENGVVGAALDGWTRCANCSS
jgi:hypothetical protein